MKIPEKVPAVGYYYHYKHDPNGPINNYAYEMIGVGCHTEEEGVFFVVYQPLYEASVYKAGKFFDLRPLEMWMGDVVKNGATVPRFSRITDANIVARLKKTRQAMYGN